MAGQRRRCSCDVLGGVAKSGFIAVHVEPDQAVARSLVANGTFKAALVIPPGFSSAVQSNREASLEVIGHADAAISTEVARSIAEAYASELNRVRLSVATVVAGHSASGGRTTIQALATAANRAGDPVAVPVMFRRPPRSSAPSRSTPPVRQSSSSSSG
jgi:hypothetical protein